MIGAFKSAIERVLRNPTPDQSDPVTVQLVGRSAPSQEHCFGPLLAEELKFTTDRLAAARERVEAGRKHPDNREGLRQRIRQLMQRTGSPLLGEDLEEDLAELEEARLQLQLQEGIHAPADQLAEEVAQLEHRSACLEAVRAGVQPADLTDDALGFEGGFWADFVPKAYARIPGGPGSRYGTPTYVATRSEWMAARERQKAVRAARSERRYDQLSPDLAAEWERYGQRRAAFRARLAELAPEAAALGRQYQELQDATRQLQSVAARAGINGVAAPGIVVGSGSRQWIDHELGVLHREGVLP